MAALVTLLWMQEFSCHRPFPNSLALIALFLPVAQKFRLCFCITRRGDNSFVREHVVASPLIRMPSSFRY